MHSDYFKRCGPLWMSIYGKYASGPELSNDMACRLSIHSLPSHHFPNIKRRTPACTNLFARRGFTDSGQVVRVTILNGQ